MNVKMLIPAVIIALVCGCADRERAVELYTLAMEKYYIQESAASEQLLHQALALDRKMINAVIMLSKIYYYNRDYTAAAAAADRALAINSANSQALYWKARALVMSGAGSSSEAVSLLKSSLEAGGADPEARQLLALIYERDGKYTEALHHYHRALESQETLINIRMNLALLYKEAGFEEKGIEEMRRAVKTAEAAGVPLNEGDMKKLLDGE